MSDSEYSEPMAATLDMEQPDDDFFSQDRDWDTGRFQSVFDEDEPTEPEEEEQPSRLEEEELEDQKTDDAQKENNAITIYQETHPDRQQLLTGGREVSEHEAIWSVSSFRPHWGPDKLRDNDALTYWQSDCPNPRLVHTIDLSFHKATLIRQVSLFVDYEQDESYTPKMISIRGGTTYRDLQELKLIEVDKFVGWINADITEKNDGHPFRLFRLQIAILATHLNGRDTHIRQVKVYSVLPSYSNDTRITEIQEAEIERIRFRKPIISKGIR